MLYTIPVTVDLLPAILADIPLAPGDIFVYVLLGASVIMVLYFGLKKPKGPNNVGKA